MTTGFGNPFWDKPSQQPVKKDPWYENPWFYLWLTAFGIVGIVALANGVFIQSLGGAAALVIATGKYTITEMYVLEEVDDPFAH